MERKTRNTGIVVLAAAAAGAVAAWVIRDQMQRHSRDLFNPSFFRRLAALGHMAKAEASVDHINLMKGFCRMGVTRSAPPPGSGHRRANGAGRKGSRLVRWIGCPS